MPASVRVRDLMPAWFLISALGLSAQELWPGMEKYVTLQTTPAPALINHYSAALVAAYWEYPCHADDVAAAGYSDVAESFASPAETGEAFQIGGAQDRCPGKITAAIWADGNEIGDPEVLREFHDCRTAAWDEMHRFLKANVFAFPADKWDPSVSSANLKQKLALEETLQNVSAHDFAVHGYSVAVLAFLAQSMDDYRAVIEQHPDQLIQRRGMFLRYLKEWEQALNSPIYPEKPIWWNWP